MMQLNYERKMAVLMHKSDKILGLKRKAMGEENDDENDDEIDNENIVEFEDVYDSGDRDDNLETKNSNTKGNDNNDKNNNNNNNNNNNKNKKTFQLLDNGKKSNTNKNSQISKHQNQVDIDLMISESSREADAIFNSILNTENKYINEIKIEETNSVDKNNEKLKSVGSGNFDVEKFLRKKKVDKKKELEEASFCEYNPLDFMDWTSRSL